MSLTKSTMMKLGTQAPDFKLPNVTTGKNLSLSNLDNKKPLLVAFICQHCPYVKHVEEQIAQIGADYQDQINMIAISSNNTATHPTDAPQYLKKQAQRLDFTFPYLYDQTQKVAQKYTAACTPDFFLFDKNKKLVYRGQLDDSRPSNNIPVTGQDLRNAIEAILNNQPVPKDQKPSSGCNIKWKPGNQPHYA